MTEDNKKEEDLQKRVDSFIIRKDVPHFQRFLLSVKLKNANNKELAKTLKKGSFQEHEISLQVKIRMISLWNISQKKLKGKLRQFVKEIIKRILY